MDQAQIYTEHHLATVRLKLSAHGAAAVDALDNPECRAAFEALGAAEAALVAAAAEVGERAKERERARHALEAHVKRITSHVRAVT